MCLIVQELPLQQLEDTPMSPVDENATIIQSAFRVRKARKVNLPFFLLQFNVIMKRSPL